MQVGDMVYMRGTQRKRGEFTEDPSKLGLIQDTRFHWGDDKCEYQVSRRLGKTHSRQAAWLWLGDASRRKRPRGRAASHRALV